jgi:hypothetical protein
MKNPSTLLKQGEELLQNIFFCEEKNMKNYFVEFNIFLYLYEVVFTMHEKIKMAVGVTIQPLRNSR